MPWIVTANIGRARSPEVRRAAIKRVRRAFPVLAPIFCWQEVDEGDTGNEHQWLRRLMPLYRWAGFSQRVPIGVPRRWRIESQRVIRVHGGLSGVTPNRVIVEAVLRGWGKRVVVLNCHTVAGRWTNPGQRHEPARVRMWDQYWTALEKRVQHWHERGVTVLIAGDFNNPHAPLPHPKALKLSHHRLDYIFAVEGNLRVTVTKRRNIRLGIDGHSAHAVQVKLTRKD